MSLSVILLNYNSAHSLRSCVESLLLQDMEDMEIIVVDNASRPDDRAAARRIAERAGALFIQNTRNLGYNGGNNVGLRIARQHGAEFALISNPDMLFPQRDYLSQLAATMREDPEITVVGSDIVNLRGEHLNPQRPVRSWRDSFYWVRQISDRIIPIPSGDYRSSHPCSIVCGSCLMVRVEPIAEMGYFDENVFLYCEEDILSYQMEYLGHKIYYRSDIQAVHAHRPEEKRNDGRVRHLMPSRFYFVDNYSEDGPVGRTVAKFSTALYSALLHLNHAVKTLR